MNEQLDLRLGSGQLRIRFGEFGLTTGVGTYRISIPIFHRANWPAESGQSVPAVVLVTGSVRVAAAGHRMLAPIQPVVLTLRGDEVGDHLQIDVSPEQLVGLHSATRDRDLELLVDLSASWLNAPPAVFPTVAAQVALRMAGAMWLKLLDDNEIEVNVSIGIPLSLRAYHDHVLEPSHSRTVTLLRQARQDFREGRYRAAAQTCRNVLESLEQLVEIPTRSDLGKVKERSADERWAAVHIELKSLLDPASHEDPNAQTFTWGRLDVEAILAAVAGVVARSLGTRPAKATPGRDLSMHPVQNAEQGRQSLTDAPDAEA